MDNQIAAGTGFYPTYPLGPEISHNLKFAGDLNWKGLKQSAEGTNRNVPTKVRIARRLKKGMSSYASVNLLSS